MVREACEHIETLEIHAHLFTIFRLVIIIGAVIEDIVVPRIGQNDAATLHRKRARAGGEGKSEVEGEGVH